MADPLHRQYLTQASRLAQLDPRRPQQGNLRRAVSTAYYAMFHFLVDQSSRFLMGSTANRAGLRQLLARAYGHGEMAAVAKSFRGGTLPTPIIRTTGQIVISGGLQDFCHLFVHVQEQRHLADYDLSTTLARQEVLGLINSVDNAIASWPTLRADPATELFLTCLIVWERVRGR